MSQLQHYQTVAQEEEIEDLLTAESFNNWCKKLTHGKLIHISETGFTAKEYYLKEHGLPLDSKIKGL